MAIANITNNILTDSGILTSALVSGSGTTNYIPKFTGASALGDSAIVDNALSVTISKSDAVNDIGLQIQQTANFTASYLYLAANNDAGAAYNNIRSVTNGGTTTFIGGAGIYANNTASSNNPTDLIFWTTSGGSPSSKMTLNASGNLGLGVTPSAWGSAWRVMQLGSLASISSQNTTYYIANNWYQDSSNVNRYIANGLATLFGSDGDGSFTWRTAPNNTSGAGNAITFTQAMTLTSSGRLLINQTSDSGEQLQVNGSGKFTGKLTISNTSDVYAELTTSAVDADSLLGFSNTGDGNSSWGIGRRNTGEFWIANYTGNFLSGTRITPLVIASTGAATFSSTIQTAAPTGGTAKPWKLGEVYTEPCGVPTTFGELANQLTDKFIRIEVDGVVYYIPTFNPSWC